jgi:SAM-dependent methyltransferase
MSNGPSDGATTPAFTAHNIHLPDGSFTMPDMGWTIAESPWMTSMRRVLETVFPGGVTGKRILDLGCLEGGYTTEFARMGMAAVGVEVRQSNYENCEFVRRALGLANLRFVRDDVWNIAQLGPQDAVFCGGLLYHLDRPRAFINLMASLTPKVVIINTHYATPQTSTAFTLSEIEQNEGLSGRWYHEHDEDDASVLDTFKWTSWSNKRSFWLTKPAILVALRDAGFAIMFEQFDWLGEDLVESMTDGYYATHSRTQFVGIRS